MTDHYHDNCQALLGSLSEYIDGELPADLCQEIEKHLEGCSNCRVVLNTTKRTIDLVQIPRKRKPSPRMCANVSSCASTLTIICIQKSEFFLA